MIKNYSAIIEILFWIGIGIVFYTYLGYGIVLYLMVKIKELFVKPRLPRLPETLPKAKYCSDACRREHEQRRAKEARRKGVKPKRDRVDRYLAGSGPAHDEIMAMRREVAMRY